MSRRLVLAGVAVVVAVAAIAAVGLTRNRVRDMTITAQFDNAAGLYVGNTVAVLGISVGQVTKVTSRGGYAEVEFTVDDAIEVPADVQAVTLSTSILTDRQIELSPPYRGGPRLRNGDTIGLNRTRTPVEFDRVLGVLDKTAVSLRGDGAGGGPVADFLRAGDEVVAGHGAQIKDALGQLSQAVRVGADGGAETRRQVTSIVQNLSALLDAAATNDSTLREFGATVRQLSAILANENFGSGDTGRELNQVVNAVGKIITSNRDVIKQGIVSGDKNIQALYDKQRELAELFDVLPLMADNLYNTIDQRNGALRAHFHTDRLIFDGQTAKEVCNLMGLRQLGCSTGTLQDYGPDFGLTNMLDGLTAMGQK